MKVNKRDGLRRLENKKPQILTPCLIMKNREICVFLYSTYNERTPLI